MLIGKSATGTGNAFAGNIDAFAANLNSSADKNEFVNKTHISIYLTLLFFKNN